MKKLLLAGIVSLVFNVSKAQGEAFVKSASLNDEPAFFTQETNNRQQWALREAERYRRMRNTGKVLTFSGIGLMAAGGILIATSDKSGPFSSWDGQAIAGSMGLLAGALSTAGGIILWSSGNKKIQQGGASIQLQPGSAALVYQFN